MADDGEVLRNSVIDVLRNSKVGVSTPPESEGWPPDMYLLAKGEKVEVIHLPEWIGWRLLHYLSRNYAVPIHFFYNPQMALPLATDKLQ